MPCSAGSILGGRDGRDVFAAARWNQGHVAAVLAHFSGQGGTTEAGDEVDRSLEGVTDAVPFDAAARCGTRALADALLTSHMRYRGFAGNPPTDRAVEPGCAGDAGFACIA